MNDLFFYMYARCICTHIHTCTETSVVTSTACVYGHNTKATSCRHREYIYTRIENIYTHAPQCMGSSQSKGIHSNTYTYTAHIYKEDLPERATACAWGHRNPKKHLQKASSCPTRVALPTQRNVRECGGCPPACTWES